jgi:peptidyl-prolyl cis-trans isomerase B (cyclophilin B)
MYSDTGGQGAVAGNRDRERKRARERYERQRQQRLQRQAKIRRLSGIGTAVVLVIGLAVGLTLGLAGGGAPKAAPKPTTSKSSTASPSASATPTASTIAEPAHHCDYIQSGTAAKQVSLPPATPDYKASYTATINTNVGKIEIALANSKATCTVNSFVHLASANFWNGSQCHRVSNSGGLYMLQCGDPLAKSTTKLTCSSGSNSPGTGGPGYEFGSENLTGATYKAGTLAMANSGTPTSNGSQFFLVFKNSSLPAQYTPFGTITAGLDILQKVANAGTSCNYAGAGGGAPKDKVVIDSVTIKKA